MAMCNVKGGVCSNRPTGNYQPALQFPSAKWDALTSFILLLYIPCPASNGRDKFSN